MKVGIRLASIALFAIVLQLTACVSVPMASDARDAGAKTFVVAPDKANIYVYRNEAFGAAVKMPVTLNGKPIGETAAHTFFKLEVAPGDYLLVSNAENESSLRVKAVAGNNYFVWQEVKMGLLYARSALKAVDESAGRMGVQECKRIEELAFQ